MAAAVEPHWMGKNSLVIVEIEQSSSLVVLQKHSKLTVVELTELERNSSDLVAVELGRLALMQHRSMVDLIAETVRHHSLPAADFDLETVHHSVAAADFDLETVHHSLAAADFDLEIV